VGLLTPYVLLRNQLDYPLRRLLRFRREVRGVRPAGLDAALATLDAEARARAGALIDCYDLRALVARGRRRDVLENLYYLDLLLTAFERGGVELPAGRLVAVDVGVSDWFYAPALAAALRRWHADEPRRLEVLGFEADPGRRYADGHTREDWAAWHTAALDGLHYVPEDARRWRGAVDVALMLFPFLFARDLDRWGLPRSLHRPRELLAHAWSLVRPGGSLVVANQGEAERDEQLRHFAALGIPVAWTGHFASPFFAYPVERYLHVARRPG
jgi:hypothetical protein